MCTLNRESRRLLWKDERSARIVCRDMTVIKGTYSKEAFIAPLQSPGKLLIRFWGKADCRNGYKCLLMEVGSLYDILKKERQKEPMK